MVGLGIPVAGSADGPALVVGVVGMPSNHAVESRGGFGIDVTDDGSHASVTADGVRGVLDLVIPIQGMFDTRLTLSGGERAPEAIRERVAECR